MDRHNRRGARGDRRRDTGRVEVEARGSTSAPTGTAPTSATASQLAMKVWPGHDDFVAGTHTLGPQGDRQGIKAVADPDAVARSAICREFLFECLDLRAEDQAPAVARGRTPRRAPAASREEAPPSGRIRLSRVLPRQPAKLVVIANIIGLVIRDRGKHEAHRAAREVVERPPYHRPQQQSAIRAGRGGGSPSRSRCRG